MSPTDARRDGGGGDDRRGSRGAAGPREAGHRSRKRFGQNFLRDDQVIERLLAAIAPLPGDTLIEVGPGLGALTWPLLARAGDLTVVEIDRDLIARLEARAAPGLRVVAGDVLGIDLAGLHPGRRLRVVGNLPYNIGTPLILRLVERHATLADVHVMLQHEVVERLAAVPGTRAYGRLTVLVARAFTVTPLFAVPPGAFEPPPKVHSAIVRLVPRADAPSADELERLSRATRLAFSSKRKTLRNNLRGHLEPEAIEALGIDPGARAETLDGEAFSRLAAALVPSRG